MITVTAITGGVRIAVKVDSSSTYNFDDTSSSRLTGVGTVGFLTHDAVPMIKSVLVTPYPTTTPVLLNQSSFTSVTDWHLGGARADGGGNRWSTVSYQGATRLTRAVPTQKVSIWTAPRRPGATRPDVDDLVGAEGEFLGKRESAAADAGIGVGPGFEVGRHRHTGGGAAGENEQGDPGESTEQACFHGFRIAEDRRNVEQRACLRKHMHICAIV